MRLIRTTVLFALLATASASAQYNQKGRVHLSLGAAIGGHATEWEVSQFGYSKTETDAAATTTFPIRVGYAITNRFVLGLLIEPGRYVPDTADANQNNSLAIVALEPRFFLVNGGKVGWSAYAQLGSAALRIQDDTPGAKVDARLLGQAFGLGSGVTYGFTDHVGIGFDVRYLGTSMDMKKLEFNDADISDLFDATLRTRGVTAELSIAFRFGGK